MKPSLASSQQMDPAVVGSMGESSLSDTSMGGAAMQAPRGARAVYRLPAVAAMLEAIQDAQKILVTAHARPDGDAVGSVLACGMMLEQMGKHMEMAFSDRVPLIYRWLPCAQRIGHWQRVDGDFDPVVLLECDGIERSRLKGLEGRRLVNIDHHTSGRNFAHLNWIEPHSCAGAEQVFSLACAAGVHVPPEVAPCLYMAVP